MARVVQLLRVTATGAATFSVDLRAINAYGMIYQGVLEGEGTFEVFGGFFGSALETTIAQSLINGVVGHRIAHFGLPVLWDTLFVQYTGAGGFKREGCFAFLDEPIEPFGHLAHRQQNIVALAAAGQLTFLGPGFLGYARALEIFISGNRAFSLLYEASIGGITVGPNVLGKQTVATGGMLTVVVPMPDDSAQIRVRNDDGALAMTGAIHVRQLFGTGIVTSFAAGG